MPEFINLAGYRFAPLGELPELRDRLLRQTKLLGLRGTILLSTEGINLVIAGTRTATTEILATLRAIPGLADLTPKESSSAEQPFNRMLVKIKKEIIAFGVEGINPALRPTAKLSAATLKQWLDEGRPVTLLDTRNDYEIRMGTFRGARPAGINQFRDFPAAVAKLPATLKNQPVVMFCTGGIRCEKAGPLMEREGFTNVHQLDGGILKYFEDCGGAHYEGECFVFDRRVGVDPQLRETGSVICFNCQMPLTVAEQKDPRFVPDKSCPQRRRKPSFSGKAQRSTHPPTRQRSLGPREKLSRFLRDKRRGRRRPRRRRRSRQLLAGGFPQLVLLALPFPFHPTGSRDQRRGRREFLRFKSRDLLPLQSERVPLLDQFKVRVGLGADKAHRHAVRTGPARPADAVHIVHRRAREVVVHHRRQVVDVQAPRREIRGHQHA